MDVRVELQRNLSAEEIDGFELWCWRILLRVPWTARISNQSILKEISPECSLQGLMLKLKLILWLPDAKDWFIRKDHDACKDWRQEEKGTTEDETVGWHHQRNGHEFVWAPGVGDGQGGLACYSPWGHKESDTNEWLNCTEWGPDEVQTSDLEIQRKKLSWILKMCSLWLNYNLMHNVLWKMLIIKLMWYPSQYLNLIHFFFPVRKQLPF